MIHELVEQPVTCPFCGERIALLLDPSAGGQCYVEDCQVCCRPITVSFEVHDGVCVNVQVSDAG